MNIEETKEVIKIMQAFVDGEEIECSCIHFDEYSNNSNPSCDWLSYKCRIKKKKVKLYKYAYKKNGVWKEDEYFHKNNENLSTRLEWIRLYNNFIEVDE